MEGPTTSYDQPLEDGDVCRVCRSGAPEDGELFWPCQCSGSMRVSRNGQLEGLSSH